MATTKLTIMSLTRSYDGEIDGRTDGRQGGRGGRQIRFLLFKENYANVSETKAINISNIGNTGNSAK